MSAPAVPDIAQGNEAFSIAMRAFHTWEAGELYQAVNDFMNSRLLPTNTTSITSNSISPGNKTFTVETWRGFMPGQFIVAANTAAPANYIQGQVITYNSATGALLISNITSGGTGTFAAWTITQSLSGAGATLGSNSYSGNQTLATGAAFRTSISTLASSTTPDIWTSQSNTINYTGTATATGFAAAPQAGMSCTLICAAAAPFTASANMLIDGYATGETVTLAANDRMHIIALSTTQFLMHIESVSAKPLPSSFATAATFNAGTNTTDALNSKIVRENSWVYLPEQASTSGTVIDFTGIPAWATEVEVMGIGVSTNGTADLISLLGDAGGFEVTGYSGQYSRSGSAGSVVSANSTSFIIQASVTAAMSFEFVIRYSYFNSSNTWVINATCTGSSGTVSLGSQTNGNKALTQPLTQVRITSVTPNTFDGGAIRLRYR